jgi:hypothetical protein
LCVQKLNLWTFLDSGGKIPSMAQIDDKLKRRRELVATIEEAFREIERIDTDLLNRIEKARDAILGEEPERPRLKFKNPPGGTTTQFRSFSVPVEQPIKKKGRVPSLQVPIVHVLGRFSRPITQAELLKFLDETGVQVKGKRPKNTLSAHVSYLISKGVLVRVGDRIALKQTQIPGTENESATKTH